MKVRAPTMTVKLIENVGRVRLHYIVVDALGEEHNFYSQQSDAFCFFDSAIKHILTCKKAKNDPARCA